MNLMLKYKDNKCPVCSSDLIFNHDYSKVNCLKQDCIFNKEIDLHQQIEFKNGSRIEIIKSNNSIRSKVKTQ